MCRQIGRVSLLLVAAALALATTISVINAQQTCDNLANGLTLCTWDGPLYACDGITDEDACDNQHKVYPIYGPWDTYTSCDTFVAMTDYYYYNQLWRCSYSCQCDWTMTDAGYACITDNNSCWDGGYYNYYYTEDCRPISN